MYRKRWQLVFTNRYWCSNVVHSLESFMAQWLQELDMAATAESAPITADEIIKKHSLDSDEEDNAAEEDKLEDDDIEGWLNLMVSLEAPI